MAVTHVGRHGYIRTERFDCANKQSSQAHAIFILSWHKDQEKHGIV